MPGSPEVPALRERRVPGHRICRYLTFQMAEVAVPRDLFRKILSRIDELRPPALAAG
jgi:hypothetical protein